MPLKIPSIFAVIDKVTAPIRAMGAAVDGFIQKMDVATARSSRLFRKLTPSIDETTGGFMSFAKKATIAAAIVSGLVFTGRSLVKYQDAIANLSAVTGASGKDLDVFKAKIKEVALDTKTSSIFVADAFTAVGNNMPALLKDAEALGSVTKAAIILAKASKMELAPASESLTQVMNQFGIAASKASKIVDILAAGSVAGSSEIKQTAEAIQKFGTIAVASGVKIDESVALIELASRFEKGAEAGTKLRVVLSKLASIKALPDDAMSDLRRFGVNINLVADATKPFSARLKELSKVAGSVTTLGRIFGDEAKGLAAGVLSNVSQFDSMLAGVNTAGVAAEMAGKNMNTLSGALQQLSDRWVTITTTSAAAGGAMSIATGTIQFLTNNLDTIVALAVPVLAFFGAWKLSIMAMQAATWLMTAATVAFNVVQGVALGLTGGYNAVLMTSKAAYYAYTAATYVAVAAQWAWNAAMTANPIGLVIVAIAALVALIVVAVKKWESWGAAIAVVLGPLGYLISVIQSLRHNWDMVKDAFTSNGIIGGILAIGKVLLDAVLYPLQAVLKLAAHLPGALGRWAQSGADGIEHIRTKLGTAGQDSREQQQAPLPAVNQKANEQRALYDVLEVNKRQSAEIVIRDESGKAELNKNTGGIPINLTSTLPGYSF